MPNLGQDFLSKGTLPCHILCVPLNFNVYNYVFQATDLNNAIKYMHDHTMYSKLVLYIEACESGSMFKVIKD